MELRLKSLIRHLNAVPKSVSATITKGKYEGEAHEAKNNLVILSSLLRGNCYFEFPEPELIAHKNIVLV
jgi:hypothetical protein